MWFCASQGCLSGFAVLLHGSSPASAAIVIPSTACPCVTMNNVLHIPGQNGGLTCTLLIHHPVPAIVTCWLLHLTVWCGRVWCSLFLADVSDSLSHYAFMWPRHLSRWISATLTAILWQPNLLACVPVSHWCTISWYTHQLCWSCMILDMYDSVATNFFQPSYIHIKNCDLSGLLHFSSLPPF